MAAGEIKGKLVYRIRVEMGAGEYVGEGCYCVTWSPGIMPEPAESGVLILGWPQQRSQKDNPSLSVKSQM